MTEELELAGEHPFGSRLREAIKWFLIDGTDLMSHLRSSDVRGVLYVGRRVEHAWRRLDHFAQNWLEDDRSGSEEWDVELARMSRERSRLPTVPSPDAGVSEWVCCARVAFEIAGDAVNALEPDSSNVRVSMRVAREAYSLFRVAKYRWIEFALEPEDLVAVAHQVLDA